MVVRIYFGRVSNAVGESLFGGGANADSQVISIPAGLHRPRENKVITFFASAMAVPLCFPRGLEHIG